MEIGLFSLMAGVMAFGMWLHSYLIDTGVILKYKKRSEEPEVELTTDGYITMQAMTREKE